MPHKNFSLSRSIHVRAIVYVLVILAAVVSLPSAFTRPTVLAQEGGGGAPADTGDAQPRAEFIRQLSLPASDVVYNPADGTLYASMPSSAGAAGNTIVPINPATGETGAPVFVGSEPGKLVMSDDGRTMYISLNGATGIRRFDTATRTPGQQFSIGNGSISNYAVNDLAVAPGNPNLVAVVRHRPALSPPSDGVAVFDNGVQRSKTSPGHTQGADFLAFSATQSKLYSSGQYSYLQTMTIDASGVAATNYTLFDIRTRIKFANGRLYSATGQIIDPETKTLLGTFPGAVGSFAFVYPRDNAFVIDTAAGRAYYFTTESGGPTLKAFDLNTFQLVGSATLPGITGMPTATVRWGTNGIAFRTDAGVYLVQTSLIPSSDPIPTPTPSVSPTPTPTPPPTNVPVVVNKVNLPAKDLVINAATQTLYASVPGSAGGAAGNSITSIDPATGAIGASTFVGSEPGKLAISDDGQVLYVNLEGAKAIRRFDIATKTPGVQFSFGANKLVDMEVMPGSRQSLAVSRVRETLSIDSVAIYDDGVQRPNTSGAFTVGPIEFGSTPSTLHGYNNSSSGFDLVKFELDASGVQTVGSTGNIISGFDNGIEFALGRLYSTGGVVVDPETDAQVGRFNRGDGPVGATTLLVDTTLGRVFFLSTGTSPSGTSAVLTAYDMNTFLRLGSATLPGVVGVPAGLVRWGTDGLAFCMLPDSSNPSAEPKGIYLIRSELVSDGKPVPSMFQFSAPSYTVHENSSVKTLITVMRTGSVTGAATVNYATGGGTATPGSDYTPTSGTLSFAEGETTKTFTVSLIDDNGYEGATRETIGLTLSAPSGGAVLGPQKTSTLTIQDSKSRPSLIPVTLAVPEGESGATNAQFVVRLSHTSADTISANYATGNLSATAGSDYVAASGTITFQPGELEKTIPLQINGDTVEEPNERFAIFFSNLVNATLTVGTNVVTIINDDGTFIQFAAPTFTASEGDGRATITVSRFGPTSAQATVNYVTVDDSRAIRCDDNSASGGAAFARCDYATTIDSLLFAPGETSKTFTIPLVDDGHVEPVEFVNLQLTSALGATVGAQSAAVLSVTDNDAPSQANPIDAHEFFVRQHYLDFLSREPEADGLAAWTDVLSRCANAFNRDADSPSVLCDRNIVSSSFFRSAEFEMKGYFIYRFYRVAFNRRPEYGEFISDMRRVTGQTAEDVYSRRRSFSDAFAQRQEFAMLYGTKSNAAFVDSLLGRYGVTTINTPDPANPDGDMLVPLTHDELVAALDAARLTRAQVVRAIVQSREVDAAEYNGAFVAMQYYGYLRRTPEQAGYDAWLEVITRGDGYRVMVDGFMNSTEYRLRFGK